MASAGPRRPTTPRSWRTLSRSPRAPRWRAGALGRGSRQHGSWRPPRQEGQGAYGRRAPRGRC
eukprot:10847854-Lingulodinium_polyedra.AAC.1